MTGFRRTLGHIRGVSQRHHQAIERFGNFRHTKARSLGCGVESIPGKRRDNHVESLLLACRRDQTSSRELWFSDGAGSDTGNRPEAGT